MPRFTPIVSALLVSALALPAAAGAADPLLSGYAGPGDGEQVVLGATVVGGKGGSSGGGGATGSQQDQSLRATTTAAAPSTSDSGRATSTLTRKPQRKKSSSTSSQQKAHGRTTTPATTSTAAAPLPGAPAVVAYPTRAGAVSGPPISVGGAILLVLGLTALVLAALGLRRLIKPPSGRPPSPQVSAF